MNDSENNGEQDPAWDHFSIGLELLGEGNHAGSIEELSKAIEIDPSFSGAYRVRGAIHGRMGDEVSALRDLNLAVQLDPDFVLNRIARGLAYLRTNSLELALADLNKAVDLDPNYRRAHFQRGKATVLAYGERALECVLPDFDRAIQLDTKNSHAYFYRGLVRYSLQDFAGALSDLQTMVSMTSFAPATEYAAIWCYLSSSAVGQSRTEGQDRLAQFLRQRQWTRYWPIPVMRYYLGEISDTELFAAAYTSDQIPPLLQRLQSMGWRVRRYHTDFKAQALQAEYYIGANCLILGNRSDAMSHFRLASDLSCNFPESWALMRLLQSDALGKRNP